jgi:hypothetical protein
MSANKIWYHKLESKIFSYKESVFDFNYIESNENWKLKLNR